MTAVQSADRTEPATGRAASPQPGEAAAGSRAGLEAGIACMTQHVSRVTERGFRLDLESNVATRLGLEFRTGTAAFAQHCSSLGNACAEPQSACM